MYVNIRTKVGDLMEFIPYVWLGLSLVLAVVEISTTQLVSIWFVIGAAATAVCSATFLKGNIVLQILVFVLISAIMLVLTRPLVKKLRKNEIVNTNSDRNIGKTGVVLVDIDPETGKGLVRIGNEKWSAKSKDNLRIKEGSNIRVLAIEGVKLIVEAQNERKD